MVRGRKLDKDKRLRALACRLAGWSYQEIGKKFNLSRQRIQQLLRPPRDIYLQVIEKAGSRCERCHIFLRSILGHIHHKENTDFEYNSIRNLLYLCASCHGQVHHIRKTNEPEVIIKKLKELSMKNTLRRSCAFYKCKQEFQPKAENQKFHVGECRMRTFYIKKEGGPYAIMQNEWEVALKTAELTRLKGEWNG